MTNSFLAKFDAMAHRAFARVGLADRGTYEPEDGPVIEDVRVYINRNVQRMGVNAEVIGGLTLITLLREDVPSPRRNAVVAIGDERFVLEKPDDQADEGVERWIVGVADE